MKVMVIVKASKASEAGEMPSEKMLTEMGKFNEQLAKAGVMLAGEGLQPSSKGYRVRFSGKDRTVIDGPFAETKELIAGYWLWKVKSMAEAIEWVKRCPNPHDEPCEVEIRQVFSAEDFGDALTPELREQEASIRSQALGLGTPRFEQAPAMTIAGMSEHYTPETRQNIDAHWHRFAPHIGKVPGQTGAAAYGVCSNSKPDCSFDYLAGVQVGTAAKLPPGFTKIELPARRYIVFRHDKHIKQFPQAIDTIWTQWAPEAGLKIAKSPCFERYSEEFNPQTGFGGIEFWIPLEA
jgi:predicted transcriptional regulator YdeE